MTNPSASRSEWPDPNVDDDIRTMLGYDQKLGPGEDVDVVFPVKSAGPVNADSRT